MDKFYPYAVLPTHGFLVGFPPPPPTPAKPFTYYDYLVVVDFEATCDDTRNNSEQLRPLRAERPEIIQFPAILIDVTQMRIVDYFDSYVKPVEQPTLSNFCTTLTGITQSEVDKAVAFPKVLRRFERWLKKHGLSPNSNSSNGNGRTFAIVADGSYDMGHFLYKQCLVSNIPFPAYARRWVNIRTVFSKFYRQRWYTLKIVLEMMGQPFEGRMHNGLDDAKNIAKVLIKMLADGCLVTQTEKIVLDSDDQKKNEIRILNDKHSGKYDLATVIPVVSHECILVLPTNAIYRQHPETDYIPPSIKENKENLPSSKTERKKSGMEKTKSHKIKTKKPVIRTDYAAVTAAGSSKALELVSVAGEE